MVLFLFMGAEKSQAQLGEEEELLAIQEGLIADSQKGCSKVSSFNR